MPLFDWENGGKCVDCGETMFLTVCDKPGCLNKMCTTHIHLQPNSEEYCSKCDKTK